MFEFREAYERLRPLHELVEKDPVLRKHFIDGRYDFWQMYVPMAYLAMREHIAGKMSGKGKLARLFFILTSLAVFAFSLLSFLVLLVLRPKILIFSGDRPTSPVGGDFRIAGLYRFLRSRHIPYLECFYTNLDIRFFRNSFKRCRPALYLEALDALYFLFKKGGDAALIEHIVHLDLSRFGDTAAVYRSILLTHAARIPRSLFKIRVLTALLKLTSVTTLLTIDNVRYYHELLAACRSAGIRTYAFQHGQFTRYQLGWLKVTTHSGTIVKPDKLVVWSEYWKNELLTLGTFYTPEELIVGGNPKGEVPPQELVLKEKIEGKIRVLIPYESDPSREEFLKYKEALEACNDVRLYFKIRPDRPVPAQLALYGFRQGDVETIFDLRDGFSIADVVVGMKSTFLYDTVEYERPVVLLKNAVDHLDRMVENGLALRAESPDELCEKIREAAKTTTEELRRRRVALAGERSLSIEDTLCALLAANR